MRTFVFLTFFLITECYTLSTGHARDLGTHGVIYSIEEEDPIILIQSKLKRMEERGELERHHQELQQKAKAAIEHPKPVEGITKARESRVAYYDPTYEVSEDIKDHTGRVFYKKGAKINPLETVSLSQSLLFFDGDDEEQVAFAREKLKESSLKLILVKGAPLTLSEHIKVPVYFDQAGLLTKKLGIGNVPALVTQEEKQLRIEEILLSSLKSESKEGKNR
ncbi:MAG: type-F conjugative transfer system protein TraW [Alphaproteobacteria bacterium]|nr:type-F conjugative transfer system protein TraW [Alphaproteobacteria bacterium]